VIEIRAKQIVVAGQPRAGDGRGPTTSAPPGTSGSSASTWLQETGCGAVASYLPWVFHELPDGTIDVTGTTGPERDVAAFIDLCHARGLWFIARPGPFVMAELKSEGIPYRVYGEHPEVVPCGWDDTPTRSRTVDYLAPALLAETAHWYDAIMAVVSTTTAARRCCWHRAPR